MKSGIPVLVKSVVHRARDADGRRIGHNAYVQRRSEAKLRKNPGLRFGAWARRTVDGRETGSPERYCSYDGETEATAHACYAAGAGK